MKKIPVIIFCYNRPNKLKNLLNEIKKNSDYKSYKYFFFCDGPKNNLEIKKCKYVFEIASNFNVKFKSIKKNKINLGLSKNIISGLNIMFGNYDSAIILEDDLSISKNTLKFLSQMLFKYRNHKNIGSITAYSYIHNFNQFDNKLYLVSRHCSWGWGTWKNVWNKINWNDYRIKKDGFSKGGYDLKILLQGQKKNLINSWAIRFNLFCHNNNLKCIMPRYSLVNNLGFDKDGTHTKKRFFRNTLLKKKKINLINYLNNQPAKNSSVSNKIRYMHKPSIKLIFRLLMKFFM